MNPAHILMRLIYALVAFYAVVCFDNYVAQQRFDVAAFWPHLKAASLFDHRSGNFYIVPLPVPPDPDKNVKEPGFPDPNDPGPKQGV